LTPPEAGLEVEAVEAAGVAAPACASAAMDRIASKAVPTNVRFICLV